MSTRVSKIELLSETARYETMESASAREFAIIEAHDSLNMATEPERILQLVRGLKGWTQGLHVDVYEHSIQTATRALKDDRSEEYVVCALLHDIGDSLSANNHAEVAAAVLRPFVSEELHWMVAHHDEFQLFHKKAMPEDIRNIREKYRGHPHFEITAEFCEKYDQVSFDAEYDSLPLEYFEPMVRRVFSTPWSRSYDFESIDLSTMKKHRVTDG